MEEKAVKALTMLRGLRSVVFSTVADGTPQSRIIDVMVQDDGGLIFTTCRIKPFYRQLKESMKVSLTGMTKDHVQIRLNGDIKEIDKKGLDAVYEANPDFDNLFPKDQELGHFQVFRIYRGKGEIFDLSGKEVKMQRERFAFGGETVNQAGCTITDKCIACGKCAKSCPFNAISLNEEKNIYAVDSRFCDECGICFHVCPAGAVELPAGL